MKSGYLSVILFMASLQIQAQLKPVTYQDEKQKLTGYLINADADWQMIYYSDAVHSFTDPGAGNDNSKGAAFNAVAAARSWQHMMLFLEEVLK